MTKEQYHNHDCKLSSEDSCDTCTEWFSCNECHGTGENIIEHSEDDTEIKKCHCKYEAD